jgi:limonene-1,2-epoxide hydrolase
MSDPAESVVRQFFAAWADPTPDRLASFFSADAEYVSGPGEALYGSDAIKSHYQELLAAGLLVKTAIEVKTLLTDGRVVMAERVDTFALAGKTLDIETVGVFVIDGNGRIKRFRDYFDVTSVTDQIKSIGGG